MKNRCEARLAGMKLMRDKGEVVEGDVKGRLIKENNIGSYRLS